MDGLGVVVPMLFKMIEGKRVIVALLGIGEDERILFDALHYTEMPHA